MEPRSLLVLKDEIYTDYLHGIEEITQDVFTGKKIKNKDLLGDESLKKKLDCEDNFVTAHRLHPRISLTIRNVPKSSKFKLIF